MTRVPAVNEVHDSPDPAGLPIPQRSGGPRAKWVDRVVKDMGQQPIKGIRSFERIKDKARDRKRWQKLCDDAG